LYRPPLAQISFFSLHIVIRLASVRADPSLVHSSSRSESSTLRVSFRPAAQPNLNSRQSFLHSSQGLCSPVPDGAGGAVVEENDRHSLHVRQHLRVAAPSLKVSDRRTGRMPMREVGINRYTVNTKQRLKRRFKKMTPRRRAPSQHQRPESRASSTGYRTAAARAVPAGCCL
jgi:hypothetical protein